MLVYCMYVGEKMTPLNPLVPWNLFRSMMSKEVFMDLNV